MTPTAMTLKDTYVGKRGTVPFGKAMFAEVEVLDAKTVYGTVRLFVQPVAGDGQEWVDVARFELLESTGGAR